MHSGATRRGIPSAVLVVGGAFALWEVGVLVLKPPAFLLPAPSEIFARLASEPEIFMMHALYSLGACMLGFAIAFAIGIALAIAIVHSRFLEMTLYTLLVALNSIPKIAVAPLFIIWMGTGSAPKVAVSATIALWAVVTDAVLGLRSVEPDMLDLSRSLRASRLQILWRVRFPIALPAIFAGTKIAISMALVGVIVGEFVTSNQGLGFAIMYAQGTFDAPMVYASILLLGILGTALFYIVDILERMSIPWHVSQRATHVPAQLSA